MADDDYEEQEEEVLDPNVREGIRSAERAAKKAQKENEDLKRELAFSKAGIPDTPLTATLAKTYTGENDPTAIKAYFESLGVEITGASAGSPQPEPVPQGPSDTELAAQRQVADLGSGAGGDGAIDYDAYLKASENADQLMSRVGEAPEGAVGFDGRRITTPRID